MDITEFFQQSAGKWFSQRTLHHFAKQSENGQAGSGQSESGRSDLIIETIATDDPKVVALCQQNRVDPALALCAVKVSWNGSMDRSTEKQNGAALLVAVPDPAAPHTGELLRSPDSSGRTGRYVMGTDEALTVSTESDTVHTEERFWFASPNLRLRTSVLKRSDGFSLATFCSEIRMGGVQPPPSPAAASVSNR